MFDSILKSFEDVISNPEKFISSEDALIEDLRELLKLTYDFSKKGESESKSDALPELIIQHFDLEQIWQQLELQNNFILKRSTESTSKLVINKNQLFFNESDVEEDGEEVIEHEEDEKMENGDFEDDLNENVDEEEYEQPIKPLKKFKPSAVDDEFFKLSEMNDFLLAQEKESPQNEEDESDSEGSINMFEASDLENDESDPDGYNNKKNPRYKDFFGTKTQQLENDNYEESDYDDENEEHLESYNQNDEISGHKTDEPIANVQIDVNTKSALELREERLKKKIKELEDIAIGEKPWQLKGEVLAENRPINSLLEEVLEYDVGSRPAPIITEATTMLLEDVIKQRIKDKSFDDVERKQKPVETPLEYKKKLVLNQEKSKQSLAQIYEKEFLQQQQALQDTEEKEEEVPQLHKDITAMMSSLFLKLDALSNFHFTPKLAAPEIKIISNIPAINMEEVAPIAMTNASLLAPEEVKRKPKGDVIGENERTDADKNRERRKKKRKQKEHAKAKSKSMAFVQKPGLGNKYSKEKVKRMLEQVTKEKNVDKMDESYGTKGIKSSTAFFTRLQEEVNSQIKSKIKTPKKKTKEVFNAKKLKL
ncbi:hypothetical protein FQA39_LY11671 [Lamprigera yunnana]|nr:hypothetical protein FQA39_LY11671 [Lamprigera yunnana]